ncbi:MAG: ABC transporter ATP-binding protein [Pseudomonadota bacterium]
MIDVDGLSFEYGTGHRALNGVTFRIPKGTITALVGPNGAGKTTLLRCLSALDWPLEGTIRVAGQNTQDQPRAVHRAIGYLSDTFGLYHDLSVERNLEFMRRTREIAPERVEAVIQQLGLAAYRRHLAKSLSRGLRQRLAIGLALLHRPPVLLLDEPASGLDPEARVALGLLFRTLRAEGMTLLVSSHILAELEEYATDILILHQGQVLEHRHIADPLGGTIRMPWRIALAETDLRLEPWLAAQPQLQHLTTDESGCRFLMTGTDTERYRLLRALLTEGFAVCEFGPSRETLQDTYLTRLREVKKTDE